MLLSEFAFAVNNLSEHEDVSVDPELLKDIAEYLPRDTTVAVLTEEEIMGIVEAIKERVFVYHMPKSRINQLLVEFKALANHPDQGRILRRLYFALPDGPETLPERVRKEIVKLQWQKAGEIL